MKPFNFILSILFVLLSISFCSGQNLVPNPSFEIFTQCPYDLNQVGFATGWTAYRETPEYFNSCDTGLFSVPCNARGCQYASSGNAYCGLASFSQLVNFREHIGIQLGSQLVIGQTYYLSFKLSLADFSGFNCAISHFGMLLSTIPYDSINPSPISNFAHNFSLTPISDTTNWVKISSTIVADSNYAYLAVGCFYDNNHIDTLNCDISNATSVYYVDDVCIAVDSTYCNNFNSYYETTLNELIDIFPNPTHENVYIRSHTVHNKIKYTLFNSELKVVSVGLFQADAIINLGDQPDGLYLIHLENRNHYLNFKIIKN